MAIATLMYLRDPPWLLHMETGFEGWTHIAGERPFRWMAGRASFFVPSDHRWVDIPVRAMFVGQNRVPYVVRVSVNDRMAGGAVLEDEQWRTIRVPLQVPASWSRRVARIDLRANRTWTQRRISVQVGEVVLER
jgi:hypothetical protein